MDRRTPEVFRIVANGVLVLVSAHALGAAGAGPVPAVKTRDGKKSYLIGMPVRLVVTPSHPALFWPRTETGPGKGAGSGENTFLPAKTSWDSFISIQVTGSSVKARAVLAAVDWRAARAQPVESRLKGPNSQPLEVEFTLSPSTTSALPVGRYTVRAVYDTRRALGRDGWRGRVESPPFEFTLRAASGATDEGDLLREQARFAATKHDFPTARTRAQQAVRKVPGDREAWLLLGDANAKLGAAAEAVTALETYLDLCGVPRTYPRPIPRPGTTKEDFYHAYFGGPEEQRNPQHEAIRRRVYLLRWRLEREARIRRDKQALPPAPRGAKPTRSSS